LFCLKSGFEVIFDESGSIFKQKFEDRATSENLYRIPISNETKSSRHNPSADPCSEGSSTMRGGTLLEINKNLGGTYGPRVRG
jgi:hypothetical protein